MQKKLKSSKLGRFPLPSRYWKNFALVLLAVLAVVYISQPPLGIMTDLIHLHPD